MEWVRKFNPYDLYSKGHEPPDVEGASTLLRRADRRVFPGQARVVSSVQHSGSERTLPTFEKLDRYLSMGIGACWIMLAVVSVDFTLL